MTGKSTLLGLLGNSCEFKLDRKNNNLINHNFKTEFSEIFKGSENFDRSGSNKFKINFCDINNISSIIDFRQFRISWTKKSKNSDEKRFRVTPYKKSNNSNHDKTEAKFEWPVIYLGLSRFFPIGESEGKIKSDDITLKDDEKKWFIDNYKKILSITHPVNNISSIKIDEIKRKKGIGISADNYDYLTNSAGQDNVGQILYAVLLFKRLKNLLGETYKGGLLLIDEIDATLHPIAQNKIIEFLIKEASKQLDVQVVCTTHSISLLEYVYEKVNYNKDNVEDNNNVEIVYLANSSRDRKVEAIRNPDLYNIKNSLMIQSQAQNQYRLKVYTEDEEGRWFFSKLIQNYNAYVNLLNVKLGHDSIISLYKADTEYFYNILIVLDGDVSQEEIKKISIGIIKPNNIIRLPGDTSPEAVFCKYLYELESDHPYWERSKRYDFNWMSFKEHYPFSSDYDEYEDERSKYKEWFKKYRNIFEETDLYGYWKNDNEAMVNGFIEIFKDTYNKIAKKNLLPKILY